MGVSTQVENVLVKKHCKPFVCLMCATQDRRAEDVSGAGEEVRVLTKAEPSQRESLQTEAEVDPMDGEQTWPTESELQEAEGRTNARISLYTKEQVN